MTSVVSTVFDSSLAAAPLGGTPTENANRLGFFKDYAKGLIGKYGDSHHRIKGYTFEYSIRMYRTISKVVWSDRRMTMSRAYVLKSTDNDVYNAVKRMVISSMLGRDQRTDIDQYNILADLLDAPRYEEAHRRRRNKKQKRQQTKRRRRVVMDGCSSLSETDSSDEDEDQPGAPKRRRLEEPTTTKE